MSILRSASCEPPPPPITTDGLSEPPARLGSSRIVRVLVAGSSGCSDTFSASSR